MRKTVQLVLLALFIYLISATKWPPSDTVLVDAFLRIDPLLSLQTMLASRTWIPAAGYGILMLVLAFGMGRFFCGWMCPMGTCLELGDDLLFGKKKTRLWKNRQRKMRGVKYALLVVIAAAAVFGHGLAYLADPICWITRLFTYCLWPFSAAVQNLALDVSRPMFESLGWMNVARADVMQPAFGPFGMISLVFFVVLLALGRYQRRFWCRVLCPLGAMLAIPSRFALFHRRVTDACDDDGTCSKTCETGAIGDRFREYDPGECIACQRCVGDCHADATRFVPSLAKEGRAPAFDLRRRAVLGSLGIGLAVSTWFSFSPKRQLLADDTLRPPGSLPEVSFLATCVRCGKCVKACPTSCLQPDGLSAGAPGLMAPITMMRVGPCSHNCNACCRVCPTGAIRDIDLDEKPYAKIGNAIIDPGRCIVFEQDRVCLVCDESCPYGAIYWKETGEGGRRPYIDENRCNGCGQCEKNCPIDGVAAIRIFPSGQIRLETESYLVIAKERGLDLKLKKDGYLFGEE